MPWGIVVQLSGCFLDRLREERELVLYRAFASHTERSSVLPVAASSVRPSAEIRKKLDHEYSLGELDPAWTVRAPAIEA